VSNEPTSVSGDGLRPGRARRIQDWLRGRADTSLGRLAFQWFRAYFAASRNSGCAVTVYSSLSVMPAALVFIAAAHPFQSDVNVFGQHLVTHMKLTGSTATLVEDTFGSTSSNALGASIAVIVSFLLWGIGIGQIYQDVYARAWGIEVGSIADQGLFALFFFILAGAIAAQIVAAERFHGADVLVLVPAWLIASTAFWLFVPSLLLHRKVGWRALLPGALMASLVIGGTIATSPLFIAAPLNQNGKAFGSFGVVLTVVGYVFVLLTMTLVCAVFSPVWRSWRESERQRA
jgi:membrane protein